MYAPVLLLFFKKYFGEHKSFLWGHRYPCFGLLVTSPQGFKASDPLDSMKSLNSMSDDPHLGTTSLHKK